MKSFIYCVICLVAVFVGVLIGRSLKVDSQVLVGGALDGYYSTASSSDYTVGPYSAQLIAATSTGRSYMRITSTSTAVHIGYTKLPTASTGEKLVSPLVFTQDNMFTGAIYAINAAGATTTLNVTQFISN